MNYRDTLITTCSALLLTPVLMVCMSLVSAQTMQSTNYRIQSDSINFGGGLSTSTNYTLESHKYGIKTNLSSLLPVHFL